MQFDRGFISPYFITDNEKRTVELDNPVIMIMDKQWSSIQKKFTIPSHFCGFWHCFTDILSSSCPHIPLPPVDPVASSTATRGFRGFFSHRIRCCWRFCPKVPWPVRSTAGVFGWAISLYNFNGKWLWFIMGILCGYHGHIMWISWGALFSDKATHHASDHFSCGVMGQCFKLGRS